MGEARAQVKNYFLDPAIQRLIRRLVLSQGRREDPLGERARGHEKVSLDGSSLTSTVKAIHPLLVDPRGPVRLGKHSVSRYVL